jgi:hypothetical protein
VRRLVPKPITTVLLAFVAATGISGATVGGEIQQGMSRPPTTQQATEAPNTPGAPARQQAQPSVSDVEHVANWPWQCEQALSSLLSLPRVVGEIARFGRSRQLRSVPELAALVARCPDIEARVEAWYGRVSRSARLEVQAAPPP